MVIYMIDESYVKYGLLTKDGKLTPLGIAYGVELIDNIRALKFNSIRSISVDHFTKVEAIPKGVISEDGKLTSIGINWLLSYMEKHIVNKYTYHVITEEGNQKCLA